MISENQYRALTLANPWWEGKPVPPQFLPTYKRPQLAKIIDRQALGRIVIIKGPRRTGKTTLMYQYIDHLINSGVNPRQILFASFDDPSLRLPLQQLLDTYHSLANPGPSEKYVFWDEIQFLPQWSAMAKVISDRDKTYHLTVSGSAASLLVKNSESLAGRSIEVTILPFSPQEILNLKHDIYLPKTDDDLMSLLRFDPAVLTHLPQIEQAVKLYLTRGGFPHLLDIQPDSLWLELMRTDIIQKAIYKDLSDLYRIKDPSTLEKLFLYLAQTTSNIVNTSSMSTQLKINRIALNQYLQYLKSAFLIHSLPKFSNYPKEILKSQDKIHLIDPGLANLTTLPPAPALLESSVVSLLLRHSPDHLYYWRQNYEVDCIFELQQNLVPIEIKSSPHPPSPKDIRGLLNFMEKYHVKTGYVVYSGPAQTIYPPQGQVHLVPDWYTLIRL